MPAKAEKNIFSAKIGDTDMSDNQLLEVIERYLNGEMNADELARFEMLRKENADIESRITEHQQFTSLLKQYGERIDLEKRLDAIHNDIDVHSLTDELMVHPSWIVQLWRNHHSKISVAASVTIFFVLGILFLSGYFINRNSSYTELRREVGNLKKSNESVIRSLHDIKSGKKLANSGKYGGTGFAVSTNGYIVTNYHVIVGADSVYVQDADGDSFKTRIVYNEPQNDIAVLKIVDTSFKALNAIPYTFKRTKSDLAEEVYTLGYPGESPVFGAGYLTSANGLNGDSIRYQVSIPVDFGNSGGPLVDSKGNIIGIIDAKQTRVEGAHFAVKSSYLLKALQSDSLNNKITLNTKNTLAGLSRTQQLKKLKSYVFMVKVYN